MKLVIFDLDQTLVDFITVHDEATRKLFSQCFNVDARLTEIDFAGKSLTESFIELARIKHVPEDAFRKVSGGLLSRYEEIFIVSLPADASKYVLPGARELLEALSKTDNLVALYTGGAPRLVNRVLNVTGLGKYFRFAFYGTESKSRADMVRQAIEKARELTGKTFSNKDIVIIGDSIRDIECGKQFNALTIAVATGFHSEEKLASHRPDHLFKNLKDYKTVLQAIG